jgi:membrane-bound lytic murein transglycosylase
VVAAPDGVDPRDGTSFVTAAHAGAVFFPIGRLFIDDGQIGGLEEHQAALQKDGKYL